MRSLLGSKTDLGFVAFVSVTITILQRGCYSDDTAILSYFTFCCPASYSFLL